MMILNLVYDKSNSGKSSSARNICKQLKLTMYNKAAHGKWFEGYNGEDVIFIDDLDPLCLAHWFILLNRLAGANTL